MSAGTLTRAQLGAMARRFRVLAEPARLRVLQALRTGPRHVGDLVAETRLRQANLSKHLAVLHGHGMVARQRRGRFIEYGIADPAVLMLCDVVCGQLTTPPTRDTARATGRRAASARRGDAPPRRLA